MTFLGLYTFRDTFFVHCTSKFEFYGPQGIGFDFSRSGWRHRERERKHSYRYYQPVLFSLLCRIFAPIVIIFVIIGKIVVL